METKFWTEDSHRILETVTDMPRYNRWLMSHFAKHFGKNILEIGSGLGGLSEFIPKNSDVTLSDVRDDYFAYLKNNFVKIVIKLDVERNIPKSLVNNFDTLFSSNVFEHIKDDEAAFENSFSLLTQGGKLLLFVPAGPKIYGGLDVDMGHYRRYTKEGLVSKAERAGFKIIDCYYTNFIGYFLWWGRGKFLSQLLDKSHSRPDRESIQMNQGPRIDKIFAQFVNLIIAPLLYLEKIIHPPIGQSLVLIAQKTSI